VEQLQSHIWLTASSYMGKYLCISSYIRKPVLIYDFATAPLWISYMWGKFYFLLSVRDAVQNMLPPPPFIQLSRARRWAGSALYPSGLCGHTHHRMAFHAAFLAQSHQVPDEPNHLQIFWKEGAVHYSAGCIHETVPPTINTKRRLSFCDRVPVYKIQVDIRSSLSDFALRGNSLQPPQYFASMYKFSIITTNRVV
jgi:hypothetical protein